MKAKQLSILLVEDSRADARLILEVFKEEEVNATINVVRDGEEAMDFLLKRSPYTDASTPNLILLDLNLPKKDGREVLAEIKQNADLDGIPIIILTTSQSEDDVAKCYKLQASCFVTKPIDLEEFVKVIRSLDEFWFSAVKFPPEPKVC
ncbi:MAG: response regulator [Candidatus Melainabacteria bacterium]|nr:MAG: response regulator [Candidatus Melainabacteria bacterium]